jgi:hypothetical protein
MMLLPLLLQSGGSSGPGVGNPLASLFGGKSGGTGGTSGSGGSAGNGLTALESLFKGNFSPSMLPALFGGEIGSSIADLFGGVPRTQKTTQVASGLEASSNPLAQFLGNYVQNGILGQGNVLSSAGGAGFGKMAQILEWLNGNSLPGLSAGEATIGGNPVPVPRDISRLNALLGQSPELSTSEIGAFLPQIENMVSGGGTLKNLSGQIEALINSVSGQQKAGITSNPSGGGAGGNALAALFGGGGSSAPNSNEMMAKIKQLLSKGGTGSDSGNLVGVAV